jgi:pyrimidine oxygenase
MLDDVATVPGTEGVLLTFDDFVQGVEDFGQHIQPLMTSRKGVAEAAAAALKVM